jgi:hypothetical protein
MEHALRDLRDVAKIHEPEPLFDYCRRERFDLARP